MSAQRMCALIYKKDYFITARRRSAGSKDKDFENLIYIPYHYKGVKANN